MRLETAEVRRRLVDSLKLDLIGPEPDSELAAEVLDQSPSRWYLTGFLVPLQGGEDQRSDPTASDDFEASGGDEGGATDDVTAPDPTSARRTHFPSSIGLSFLIEAQTRQITVEAHWGDYKSEAAPADPKPGGTPPADAVDPVPLEVHWRRTPRTVVTVLDIQHKEKGTIKRALAGTGGLELAYTVREIQAVGIAAGLVAPGTRSVSVFLVNKRQPLQASDAWDERFAFQAGLVVRCVEPLVARPNLKDLNTKDWDEAVADLQYRDVYEYAVGHGLATHAELDENGECHTARTCWIPSAEVERVVASEIPGVELRMETLADLADGAEATQAVGSFGTEYRGWIARQRAIAKGLDPKRSVTALDLLQQADVAAGRIEAGIAKLADPLTLTAFRLANKAMAHAARRSRGPMQGLDATSVASPQWRPFQLAFVLMNLQGIVEPTHRDRSSVDLLFFPTGGGKTEAYLGLAAFTLVYRRLKYPGVASSGLSVLMRYTLRLLTLDQLGRASTLICALELERLADPDLLGPWPFEIGLWVGQASTPNRLGTKQDKSRSTARAKTIAYQNDSHKPSPIPLENCPWCGEKFGPNSFQLLPNPTEPTDLRVICLNRRCDFTRGRALPIVAVDEAIYRRLPCFLIATVDKFAAMPWTGPVGAFFGRVDRHDAHGFYGPCDAPGFGRRLPAGELPPPDLIIQDELHLISGPMGTMVGLYESALDELCARTLADGQQVRPKVIASTATVRRAEAQIRAIFNRSQVDIFPPPGPDRRDSFFAQTRRPGPSDQPRLYLGLAAQGRSLKVLMLRTYLALLGAAQLAYEEDKGDRNPGNTADPYMTLLGYFNSLRELGGSRRIVEDEVNNRLRGYQQRKRVGQARGDFADRAIAYEVVELTSRVPTNQVSEAKRRLAQRFTTKDRVDVAIATNMISVGLDITRLGLMVVLGQPKTCAEYIQATSRVGRDPARPGLVVTLMNIHRPRDRSHLERFEVFHQSFYRTVEATSVTPFSPRALDRGLAATLVALARLGHGSMTAPTGASAILSERKQLEFVVEALANRAREPGKDDAEQIRQVVRKRADNLLDTWTLIAEGYRKDGTGFQYNPAEAGAAQPLLREFMDTGLAGLHKRHKEFRANRSMRDVEPSVNLWLRTMDDVVIPGEDPS